MSLSNVLNWFGVLAVEIKQWCQGCKTSLLEICPQTSCIKTVESGDLLLGDTWNLPFKMNS